MKKIVLTAMTLSLALSGATAAPAKKAAKTTKAATVKTPAIKSKGAALLKKPAVTTVEAKKKALAAKSDPKVAEAYNAGYKAGYETDAKLKLPTAYKSYSAQYTNGFNLGRKERGVLVSNAERDGYSAGLNGSGEKVPSQYATVSTYYTNAYNKGAKEGKDKAYTAGYNAGKTGTSATASVPSQYSKQAAKYKEGYTKGYNEQVAKKQDEAYSAGLEAGKGGSANSVPQSYSSYSAKWKEGWEIGHTEFEDFETRAYNSGYDSGFVADSSVPPSIPEEFENHSAKYKNGWRSGFFTNQGNENAAYNTGVADGKKGKSADAPSVPSAHANYAEKYKAGYADGYNANQNDYKNGYNAGYAVDLHSSVFEVDYESGNDYGYDWRETYYITPGNAPLDPFTQPVSGSDTYKDGYSAGLAKKAYDKGVADAKAISSANGWKIVPDLAHSYGACLHWSEGYFAMSAVALAGYSAGIEAYANSNSNCTVPSDYSSESDLYKKYFALGYNYAHPLYTDYVNAYKAAYANDYADGERGGRGSRKGDKYSIIPSHQTHHTEISELCNRIVRVQESFSNASSNFEYKGGASNGSAAGAADKINGRPAKF